MTEEEFDLSKLKQDIFIEKFAYAQQDVKEFISKDYDNLMLCILNQILRIYYYII